MKRTLLMVAGCLVGGACIWGLHHDCEVSRGHLGASVPEAFERGNTLAVMFGLMWVAIGTFLLVARLRYEYPISVKGCHRFGGAETGLQTAQVLWGSRTGGSEGSFAGINVRLAMRR